MTSLIRLPKEEGAIADAGSPPWPDPGGRRGRRRGRPDPRRASCAAGATCSSVEVVPSTTEILKQKTHNGKKIKYLLQQIKEI